METRIPSMLALAIGLAFLLTLPGAIQKAEFPNTNTNLENVSADSAAHSAQAAYGAASSGYTLQITSTPAFTIYCPSVMKSYMPCLGPSNSPTSQTYRLEEEAADWGIYCEGLPIWVKKNVTNPSLDGKALQCSIAGGVPYSNVHCYRNLLSEPLASVFVLTLSFQFTPTTTCNNQGPPSVVQALEFSMNKWYQSTRYEFALQWQNVGTDAPQWRYWDPQQLEPNRWVPISPTITQCLAGGQWYTLRLEGEIVDDQVHYQSFCIDTQCYSLDITVLPVDLNAEDPDKDDRLAVAIQLDGNSEETPYNVYIDRVTFVRQPANQAAGFWSWSEVPFP